MFIPIFLHISLSLKENACDNVREQASECIALYYHSHIKFSVFKMCFTQNHTSSTSNSEIIYLSKSEVQAGLSTLKSESAIRRPNPRTIRPALTINRAG